MQTRLTGLLLGCALAMPMAFAQRPGTPPSATDMVQHRVQFLTTLLSLSTAQQQQAATIFTNAVSANSVLIDSLKAARQSLRDAVKANDAAGIEQAANTIGTLTAQRMSTEAKADAAFYQLLTAEQSAKYDQMQAHMPGHHGPGPGMMGPEHP
jgi:Spy/CpxP family protein refolding chaperone